MAKSKMNMKYKTKKRERNKNKKEADTKSEMKSNIISAVCVIGFIAIVYLGAIGLESLGVFEAGYTKPEISTTLSYDKILIGEVFNRPDKEYLVLFDTIGNDTNDVYVEYLANAYTKLNVYTVDMSLKSNEKYKSEESNKSAKNVSEFKINGITLVKVLNGRIVDYITGNDEIAEYLKK